MQPKHSDLDKNESISRTKRPVCCHRQTNRVQIAFGCAATPSSSSSSTRYSHGGRNWTIATRLALIGPQLRPLPHRWLSAGRVLASGWSRSIDGIVCSFRVCRLWTVGACGKRLKCISWSVQGCRCSPNRSWFRFYGLIGFDVCV